MKGCRRARRRLLARFDEGLAFEAELALERHLDRCARCRALERSAKLLEEGIALLPEPPSERVDVERAVAGVRARIGSGAVERKGAKRAAAIAAAVAFALLAGWLVRRLERGDRRASEATGAPEVAEPNAPDSSRSGDRGGGTASSPDLSQRVEAPAPLDEALEAPTEQDLADASGPLPPEARVDRARLERARQEVRVLLLEAVAGLDPAAERASVEGFAARFERITRHVVALGWPRERLVIACAEGDDPHAARAALRYLGVRGGTAASNAVATAIARGDRKRSAAHALFDLGSVEELGNALADPELEPLALRELVALGGERAARAIERAFGDGAGDAELLDALARIGAPAVEPLLRLARANRIDAERLQATLERTEGASEELARLLALEAPGERALELAELAAAIDPLSALPAIEALCVERATREDAMLCLGSIRGEEAVRALMRLRESGRVPAAYFEPALVRSLERNASIVAAMAEDAVDADDVARQEELLDFLVSSEGSGAAPALIALARSTTLAAELRRSAASAAGELGTPADVPALRELYDALGPADRRIAAAALSALHALGGEEAANGALEDATPRERQELLSLLRRRRAKGRATVSTFQLARALEPVLEARAERARRSTP